MSIDLFYTYNTADPSEQHLMFAPLISLIAEGDYVVGEESPRIYKVLRKCSVREDGEEMNMIIMLANEEPEKIVTSMRPDKVDWSTYEKGDDEF